MTRSRSTEQFLWSRRAGYRRWTIDLGDGVIVRLPDEGVSARRNGGSATYTVSGTESEGAERKRGG